LNLQDFAKLLRSQWITVCVTILVAVLGALAVTLLTTPLYQASTRLYVSATGGASVAEAYQGNRLSQERVLSYAQLLTGETLAHRLSHQGRYSTAEALPIVVPLLRAKGYDFVTVSELLSAGRPVVEQRCYDARPGDTDRDPLLARRGLPPAGGWGWMSTIFP